MHPNGLFLGQPESFWANVRLIGEGSGYSDRGQDRVKTPTVNEMISALRKRNLATHHLVGATGQTTVQGRLTLDYLEYRAAILNDIVRPNLMTAPQAANLFNSLKSEHDPNCPLPMNKQRGDKRAQAYFTGIINILIEANCDGLPCNFDPRELLTFTHDGIPFFTNSRRLDGAFMSTVDPIAIWEIKEQYYTTTFGSRVAAGVYESVLDGLELSFLDHLESIKTKHYFMIDSFNTWWGDGKSYLCRIIDMLHMGYVDEVLFGREVVERLPSIVQEWVETARYSR